MVATRLGRPAEARQWYESALRTDSTNADAWNNLGTVYESLDDTGAGRRRLRTGVAVEAGGAGSAAQPGGRAFSSGRQLSESGRRLAGDGPPGTLSALVETPAVHFDLAIALERQGHRERALRHVDAALRMDPRMTRRGSSGSRCRPSGQQFLQAAGRRQFGIDFERAPHFGARFLSGRDQPAGGRGCDGLRPTRDRGRRPPVAAAGPPRRDRPAFVGPLRLQQRRPQRIAAIHHQFVDAPHAAVGTAPPGRRSCGRATRVWRREASDVERIVGVEMQPDGVDTGGAEFNQQAAQFGGIGGGEEFAARPERGEVGALVLIAADDDGPSRFRAVLRVAVSRRRSGTRAAPFTACTAVSASSAAKSQPRARPLW